MKSHTLVLLTTILLNTSIYAATTSNTMTTPTTTPTSTVDTHKMSYAFGVMMGKRFKQFNIEIDVNDFVKGMKDAMNDQATMSDQEVQTTLMAFQQNLRTQIMAQLNAKKDQNKKDSEAFFANNKTKADVVTLPSGLQYKILQSGKGAKPSPQDTITVDYVGTTLDGKEFDSSYKRGKPMTTTLNQMIPGWVEVLQLMNAGSTWEVYIPAKLAYGERGAPPVIAPEQALIFKIHLIDVKKNTAPVSKQQ